MFCFNQRNFILNFNIPDRYPNCKCEKENYGYDTYLRYCGERCEDGETIHPHCTCEPFYKHFLEKTTNKCKPFGYANRSCPPNAIGTSPHCHCLQDYHFFIPTRGCFREYSIAKSTISCKDSKCRQFVTNNGIDPKPFLDIFW